MATEARADLGDGGVVGVGQLELGHGCAGANGTSMPVIAQSVVFPTVNPKTTITGTFAGNPRAVSLTTLAGVPQLIQNRDIFSKQREKTDARGNVIGFESTEGSLDPFAGVEISDAAV